MRVSIFVLIYMITIIVYLSYAHEVKETEEVDKSEAVYEPMPSSWYRYCIDGYGYIAGSTSLALALTPEGDPVRCSMDAV